MKDRISSIIKQKGYSPVFETIRKTYRDFLAEGLSHIQAKVELKEFFGIDNKIKEFIEGL